MTREKNSIFSRDHWDKWIDKLINFIYLMVGISISRLKSWRWTISSKYVSTWHLLIPQSWHINNQKIFKQTYITFDLNKQICLNQDELYRFLCPAESVVIRPSAAIMGLCVATAALASSRGAFAGAWSTLASVSGKNNLFNFSCFLKFSLFDS